MDNKQILVTVLLCLFAIAFIAYAVYATIFFRVRKSIDKLYKVQERYKEFSMISFSSSAKPIELLVKSNKKWVLVTEYIHDYDKYYKTQLKSIYHIINELQKTKNHFDLKFTRETLKKIDSYYDHLDQWIEDFKRLAYNSSNYQNKASKLIVDYRNLVDGMDDFLKKHILTKYDSSIFKNLLVNISRGFVSSNTAYRSLQNELFIRQMENLRKSIHLLLSYANRLYFLDKRAEYLRFIIQEIELLYRAEEDEKNLRNATKLNEIYRLLTEAKDSMQKANQSLYLLQFQDAENILNDLTKILEPLKSDLFNESEARNIVKWGAQFFSKSIQLFQNEHDKLLQSIKEVGQVFIQDAEISQKIKSIQETLELIIKTISVMQTYRRETERNYRSLLSKMSIIIDATTKLKTNLDELVKTVDMKMNIYKNVMFKINDLKLKYSQLERYIIDSKFVIYNPTYNEFLKWRKMVNIKDEALYNDYDNAIQDFETFSATANSIFIDMIRIVVELETLKRMSQLSLMFLNKYRHEDREIEKKITQIENKYREGQFENCLNECINVLKVIKRSAEYFNMNIS